MLSVAELIRGSLVLVSDEAQVSLRRADVR
jgi:hypothetical protein